MKVAIYVAIAGVLFVAMGGVFCAATLRVAHIPEAHPPGIIDVSITAADGAVLKASWLRATTPNGNCVIVLHGISDSRVHSIGFAPMFLGAGYNVLVPDSRAHGASSGEYVTYGLLEKYDVIGWAKWMQRAGCSRLYGLGESLGASILIEASSVEPVFSAIVAESAYADLRDIAVYRTRTTFGLPNVVARIVVTSGLFYARIFDGLGLANVSPVIDIERAATPVLLVHGLADERTPPENSIALALANRANALWLVSGAGHTEASSKAPAEFRTRVLNWFTSH